jgi:DNA-binding MarR family transcriptional regulator
VNDFVAPLGAGDVAAKPLQLSAPFGDTAHQSVQAETLNFGSQRAGKRAFFGIALRTVKTFCTARRRVMRTGVPAGRCVAIICSRWLMWASFVPYRVAAAPAVTRSKKSAAADPSLHSLLNQANRQVTSELRRIVGAEGLPAEFWRVLDIMSDEQGRSMSELANEAGMLLPATSKLVDRMGEAALLQRSADPQDCRRVMLHISDFGLQKVAVLRKDVREHQTRIGRAFGFDRQSELRELLQDFIRAHR